MSRILLLGDTHGDINQIEYAYYMAEDFDCDVVVQLGDFGYFEHKYGGPEFLQLVSELATDEGRPFYWLDGNHENHVLLRKTYADKPGPNGTWEIRPNLYYSPRGNRFTWDKVKFMTFGGAFSIDRSYRRVGESFWFEEEITTDEVLAATVDKTPIDVLLCHDIPYGVDMAALMSLRGRNYWPIREAEAGRKKLGFLVHELKPKFIYHGHYHIRYTTQIDFGYGTVKITGLSQENTMNDSWLVLDTDDIRRRI